MQRRMFFRSMIGAPAAVVSNKPPETKLVTATGTIPVCECGFTFLVRSSYFSASGMDVQPRQMFMECCNDRCRLYRKPFALPQVHLAPADQRVIAAVRESERREREAKERYERTRRPARRPANLV